MLLGDGIIFSMDESVDESVAALRELSAEVPVDLDDDLDHRARKCVRYQKMDGEEYIASDLAALLRQRANGKQAMQRPCKVLGTASG
jgi:hypothetical protein